MSKSLRKTIELEFGETEVSLDVTERLVEIVERTCGQVADIVASDLLVNNPMRYQVAEIIPEWLRVAGSGNISKAKVKKHVMTCNYEQFIQYVGAIQGVVLYSLQYIDQDQLDTLAQGQDLTDEEADEDGERPT